MKIRLYSKLDKHSKLICQKLLKYSIDIRVKFFSDNIHEMGKFKIYTSFIWNRWFQCKQLIWKKKTCQTLYPAELRFTLDISDFLSSNVQCLALIRSSAFYLRTCRNARELGLISCLEIVLSKPLSKSIVSNSSISSFDLKGCCETQTLVLYFFSKWLQLVSPLCKLAGQNSVCFTKSLSKFYICVWRLVHILHFLIYLDQ